MKTLQLIGNQLVVPACSLLEDIEAAALVKNCPGMFEYDALHEFYILKPHAVSAGLRWIMRQQGLSDDLQK